MAIVRKCITALLITTALAGIVSCNADREATNPAVPDKNTSSLWSGTDLITGEQVSFPELLHNKPAVLLFWATWCPYCKAFMPYAREIQADYADRGVQLVTFNTKERGQGDPKAYAESLGFPLIAIADADPIAKIYIVDFIPGLMVVDGSGKLTYRRHSTNLPAGKTVAQQWDGEVRQALDKLVGPGADS